MVEKYEIMEHKMEQIITDEIQKNYCLSVKTLIMLYGLIIKYKDKNAMCIEKCARAGR